MQPSTSLSISDHLQPSSSPSPSVTSSVTSTATVQPSIFTADYQISYTSCLVNYSSPVVYPKPLQLITTSPQSGGIITTAISGPSSFTFSSFATSHSIVSPSPSPSPDSGEEDSGFQSGPRSLYHLLSREDNLSHLEVLLRNFVQEEKMKQEGMMSVPSSHRMESHVMSKKSSSLLDLSALNKPNNQGQYGPSDYYIRGRSSHHHKQLYKTPPVNPSPKEPVEASPVDQVIGNNHKMVPQPQPSMVTSPSSSASSTEIMSQRSPSPVRRVHKKKSVENLHQVGVDSVSTTSNVSNVTYMGTGRNDPNRIHIQQQQKQPKSPSQLQPQPQVSTGHSMSPQNKTVASSPSPAIKSVPSITPSNQVTPQPKGQMIKKGVITPDPQPQPQPQPSIEKEPSVPVREKKVKKVKRSSEERESRSRSKENVHQSVDNQLTHQLTDDEKAYILMAQQHHHGVHDHHVHHQQQQYLLNQQTKGHKQLKTTSKDNLFSPKTSPSPSSPTSPSSPGATNLNNKHRSVSCDSLLKPNLIDFRSYEGPQLINFSSPFDYAKTRFINNYILSSNGTKIPGGYRLPSAYSVSEAKCKWERNILSLFSTNNRSSSSPDRIRSGQSGPVIMTDSGGRIIQRNGSLPGRNAVKPFLSRGSVAERVLLFEKAPERAHKALGDGTKKTKTPVLYKHWKHLQEKHDKKIEDERVMEPKVRRPLVRTNSTASNEIPRFYFPHGRPYSSLQIEKQLAQIRGEFDKLPGKCVLSKHDMARITKACNLPLSWKEPLRAAVSFHRIITPGSNGLDIPSNKKEYKITCDEFVDYWKKMLTNCSDDASRFIRILSKGQRNYIVAEDFFVMIQDVVDSHPGLSFLKEAFEFHSRYVHTVIARIFYSVNSSWSGKITGKELRRSNFLQMVSLLDEEEDINQITEYFSYEHFYVIYCKFWELDKDHDLIIDKHDLSRHNDAAISMRMIDRIFSGAVTRGPVHKYGKMTYSEFVWFLLSEEDKRQPRSIEYWFRCMDLNGDGALSMFELEFFYEEQVRRLEAMGIEPLPFTDTLCQMLDLVGPIHPDKISLSDLKRCRMTNVFFDTFFNLEKYLDHEQKDPFSNNKNEDGDIISDWDKYAAEEYELLVAEEGTKEKEKQ